MRLIWLVVFLLGCEVPPEVDTAPYAHDCREAEDCVGVLLRAPCAWCYCPNAAISRSEFVSYLADRERERSACEPPPMGIACGACAPLREACVAGTCVLQ